MFDCPSTLTRSIEDRVDVFKFPEVGFAWNFVPYLRKYAIYIVMHDFEEAGEAIYGEPWKENLSLIVSYKTVSSRVKN